MSKNTFGKLGLFVVAIIWGSGFSMTPLVLDHYSTFQVMALRFTIAFIVLLVLNSHKLKTIHKEELRPGILIGIFLFLAYIFQTYGLAYTSASKNSFLTAVNVVIVPFIAWAVTKNGLSLNTFAGALASLVGIGFTSFAGGAGDLLS